MRPALIPTAAAAVVIAITVSLGNWQLRRAHEKAALQARRDAAMAAPAVTLGAAVVDPAALDGRRLSVEGTFDAARTVFLDNRTRNGVAGFHVLSPLRIAPATADDVSARHVLVLRGWIARDAADPRRIPALRTPTGPVGIEGLALADLRQPIVLGGGDAALGNSSPIWQHFEAGTYARWSGLTLQPILVRQTSALDDGLERDWVQPGGGVEKHRAYAFQWYAMATATAGLWLWLGVLRRPRRAPEG